MYQTLVSDAEIETPGHASWECAWFGGANCPLPVVVGM